jgi:broad specificity phosphatase PhoE
VTIYLIRHADAGSRARWTSDDRLRPLTPEGRYQAADLAGLLHGVGIEAIRSSPYRRCIETVAPLAAATGLVAKVDLRLTEGPAAGALRLVRTLAREDAQAALCSHGDVIPDVLAALQQEDGLNLGPAPRCQKGSIWVLDANDDGVFVKAAYVAPPKH